MDLFWYFLLYSGLGCLLEGIYVRLRGEAKRDRKCRLLLPLCPVYGLGALALLGLPEAVRANPLLLFPAAALVCTAVEYVTGLFYEKVFRVSFWSYAHLPWNLQGRVCLPFSLCWGCLAVTVVDLLHPLAVRLTALVPDWAAAPVLVLFVLDTLLTARLLRRSRDTRVLRWYDRLSYARRSSARASSNFFRGT